MGYIGIKEVKPELINRILEKLKLIYPDFEFPDSFVEYDWVVDTLKLYITFDKHSEYKRIKWEKVGFIDYNSENKIVRIMLLTNSQFFKQYFGEELGHLFQGLKSI